MTPTISCSWGASARSATFDRWRRGTSLESWLFAIVRNAYLDLYRGRQVRSTHAQAVRDTSAQAIDGTRLAEDGVMVSHVLGCLAELPEDHRAALILALVEGLTYQEIAELQHVPVGTVTSRIGRARQVLRQALNEGDASEQGDADRVHVHQ